MSYTKPISHSSRKLFAKCPKQWHDKYVLGNKTETGAAAARGTNIHEEIERFYRHSIPLSNPVLMPWRRVLEALTLKSPVPEAELARTSEWQMTKFDAPEAFYRGKLDLRYDDSAVHVIADWKTGRKYPEHEEQGLDYVALSDERDAYRTEFYYIDQPLCVVTFNYTKDQRARQIDKIQHEVNKIRAEENFDPTPGNFACRYCPLSWRNGGKCEAAP